VTVVYSIYSTIVYSFVVLLLFLAFDICRFSVVIRVFHPRHNGHTECIGADDNSDEFDNTGDDCFNFYLFIVYIIFI